MNIQLLQNNEIDFKKWDALVMQSPQASIFHFSWFLEIIDEDWKALIGEDYEWIIPFISNKKQVISLPYFPYLGLVSQKHIGTSDFKTILDFWNKQFVSIDYQFGKYQFKYKKGFNFIPSIFYQKDLVKSYSSISQKFSPKITENLTIAENNKLNCISLRSLFEFVKFLKQESKWSPEEILIIQKIVSQSTKLKAGKMYAIYNETNSLSGVVFILFAKTKAYIMYSAFTENAYRQKADYKIINTILEDLALYNVSIENHSQSISKQLLEDFSFKAYHYYHYQHYTKQNLLSLLLQFLKKD